MKLLLVVRFAGTGYHGWQVQKNAPSVQKTLQEALEKLLMQKVRLTGCSRTDAGVHANAFYCTAETETPVSFPAERLPAALNVSLPRDIAVMRAAVVSQSFHPRYDALLKEYEYRICNAETRDPFSEGFVWMLPGKKLDEKRMDAAAQALVGRHDFSSFCAAGGKVGEKTREVYAVSVRRQGDEVILRISADGFLYNMVRIIVGTLYECSAGKKEDLAAILEGKKRALAGRTAPPEGLYLNRVIYDRGEFEEYLKENGRPAPETAGAGKSL